MAFISFELNHGGYFLFQPLTRETYLSIKMYTAAKNDSKARSTSVIFFRNDQPVSPSDQERTTRLADDSQSLIQQIFVYKGKHFCIIRIKQIFYQKIVSNIVDINVEKLRSKDRSLGYSRGSSEFVRFEDVIVNIQNKGSNLARSRRVNLPQRILKLSLWKALESLYI